MPQLLALEWDQFEARVVVARTRGAGVLVEHAFTVSLAPRDPGQTFADVNVGQRLQAALAARGIGRGPALVAVGRSSIELRRLSLPPAPDEELPDMVRLQALPQFGNLGEDWPLDFFPLETGQGPGRDVLAAAISPRVVGQIIATCESADLRVEHLLLRPCGAASLLIRRGDPSSHRIRLLVDLLAEEADLTILVEETIVLTRTVRLSGGDEQPRALLAEVRRTIASAQNQLAGERVNQVVLCGEGDDQTQLGELIREKLSLSVAYFDPFAGLSRSSDLKASPPAAPERFAPLLGIVLDEAAGARHAIDFLHTRQKPKPPSHGRRFAIAGAAAAALVLVLALGMWLHVRSLNAQIVGLEEKSKELDELVSTAQARKQEVGRIDEWKCGDVTWLDKLLTLSSTDRFPPAEDARLIDWTAAAATGGGGEMKLEGRARDSSVIKVIERKLRSDDWQVRAGSNRSSDDDREYPWLFDESIVVAPPDDSICAQPAAGNSRQRQPASAGQSAGGRR